MHNTELWESPCSREIRSNLKCCSGIVLGRSEGLVERSLSGVYSVDVVSSVTVLAGSGEMGVAKSPQAAASSTTVANSPRNLP